MREPEHVESALEAARWIRPPLASAARELESARRKDRLLSVSSQEAVDDRLALAGRKLSRSRRHFGALARSLESLGRKMDDRLKVYIPPSEMQGSVEVDLAVKAAAWFFELPAPNLRKKVRPDIAGIQLEVDEALAAIDDLITDLERQRDRMAAQTGSAERESLGAGLPASSERRPARGPRRRGARTTMGKGLPWHYIFGGLGLLVFLLAGWFLWDLFNAEDERASSQERFDQRVTEFEAAWETNQFAKLQPLFKKRNRAKLWRQTTKLFTVRGWDEQLPQIEREFGDGGRDRRTVTYRAPDGELTVRWLLQKNGAWGISSMKLPRRPR